MTLAGLTESYVQRKRWEATLLAREVVKTLGETMSGESGRQGASAGTGNRVSADALLRGMGVKL